MRYIIISIISLILLTGCDYTQVPVGRGKLTEGVLTKGFTAKVIGTWKGICFIWEDEGENKVNRSVHFTLNNLKKLNRYASGLEECKGYYDSEYERAYYSSERGEYSVKGTMRNKCQRIGREEEFIYEHNDGYFCPRCIKYRREELIKKIKSLEVK